MNNCCVYVLRSSHDDKFYVGITNNLKDRVNRHNEGRVASTQARAPFSLIHAEDFGDYQSARRREKFLKSGSGRVYLMSLNK